jgi:nucleotidyltransferase/DNA polymerase involved in DNA repair
MIWLSGLLRDEDSGALIDIRHQGELNSMDSHWPVDVQDCVSRLLIGDKIAEELRRSIFEECGFTCSAGTAVSKVSAPDSLYEKCSNHESFSP